MDGREEMNEPAFPHSRLGSDADGISIRDYFAAKVLPRLYSEYAEFARIHGWDEDWEMGVATDAYDLADAMLKAREK